ncbi:MAG: hypothetical protein ACFFCM_03530 [Promethearchaeota archaeon]
MNFIILGLALLVLLFYISIFLISVIQNIRHAIHLNQLLMIFLALLGYGIIFDLYRIITIDLIGFIPEFVDKFNYIIKTACAFFSVSLAIQITIMMNEQSGHKVKKESLLRIITRFYIVLSCTISILNIFTIYKTNTNEIGFYSYQINIILYLVIFLFALILGIYTSYRTMYFFKEVKNKQLLIRMTFFALIYVSLLIERFANIGIYLAFPNTPEIFMLGLSLLTLIVTFAFFFTIKNPDYLESLSAYFSVKSIYIIKNDGLLLYEFDLQKEGYLDPLASKKILVGGFIYGITSGLPEVLKLDKSVNSINFGDLNILFKHGKFIIGLLFITEYTPIISEKLTKFIDLFESHFKDQLETWNGGIDVFNSKIVQDWVFKIFR